MPLDMPPYSTRNPHVQYVCPFLYYQSNAIYTHYVSRKLKAVTVEAQGLCQRPPSALSQAIQFKVERRKAGVEAQCLCQRPPSLSQVTGLQTTSRHVLLL